MPNLKFVYPRRYLSNLILSVKIGHCMVRVLGDNNVGIHPSVAYIAGDMNKARVGQGFARLPSRGESNVEEGPLCVQAGIGIVQNRITVS